MTAVVARGVSLSLSLSFKRGEEEAAAAEITSVRRSRRGIFRELFFARSGVSSERERESFFFVSRLFFVCFFAAARVPRRARFARVSRTFRPLIFGACFFLFSISFVCVCVDAGFVRRNLGHVARGWVFISRLRGRHLTGLEPRGRRWRHNVN